MKLSPPISSGISRKKIQIKTVRDVSIVDLWAEEANFVTDSPKPLNEAIVKMENIEYMRVSGLFPNYLKAAIESSSFPLNPIDPPSGTGMN